VSGPLDERPLVASQLPEVPGPVVRLYAEQLARFRHDYMIMVRFAAAVCGTDPERVSLVDMERARLALGLGPEDFLAACWVRGVDPL
jgi:hypothetical protein